jgi:hypothetical protein
LRPLMWLGWPISLPARPSAPRMLVLVSCFVPLVRSCRAHVLGAPMHEWNALEYIYLRRGCCPGGYPGALSIPIPFFYDYDPLSLAHVLITINACEMMGKKKMYHPSLEQARPDLLYRDAPRRVVVERAEIDLVATGRIILRCPHHAYGVNAGRQRARHP